jgi:2,4-dienoyl-CoA reductase-like NADH-dependent reductase (Old Yellow Enzyme family)
MCQYWAKDGFASDWHLVHLGSRAVGGAGLAMTEAAAVEARGRITPWDLGIWSDEHIPMLSRITGFIHAYGAVAGIRLAHAGRKGSAMRPWEGGRSLSDEEGGWETVGPSPIPFGGRNNELWRIPHELTEEEIEEVLAAFIAAAQRALQAGFRLLELHFAHGYLGHSLSPITNLSNYQPAHRSLRRFVRKSNSICGRNDEARPSGLAGIAAAGNADLCH